MASNFRSAQGANKRKTYFLLAAMGLLTWLVAYAALTYCGAGTTTFVVPLAVGIALVGVWGSYYGSDKLVLTMTGALCLLRTRWTWALFEEDEYIAALRSEDTWEARAAAMIYACSSKKEKAITQKPVYCREDWSALEGRRARRKFTTRILWGCTESSEAELLDIETALQGSAYWEEAAKDMGGWDKIKKNSAVREAFYELYFPDDIPDEWSLEERAKSHGRRITGDGQAKYWHSLFWNKPSFGLVVFTQEAIRGCKWDFASFEEAYSSRKERWAALQRTWLFNFRSEEVAGDSSKRVDSVNINPFK